MTTTDIARTVTIIVPMSPPPALSPNARRRGNVWKQQRATEELRKMAWAVGMDVHVQDWMWQPVIIHEHVVWPKSRGVLPDPDSIPTYCKAALDGIVDAGIIAGDSAKHIASVTASQEKGKDSTGQIIVTITEATHGGD